MTDITIVKGQGRTLIRADSEKGKKWMKDNMCNYTVNSFTIDNDLVEDLKKELDPSLVVEEVGR